MPMYEYICHDCNAHSEAIQKFSDAPLTTCEACGGSLYRPISKTSFALKGNGWYADGYSDTKSTKKAEKKSESAPEKSTTKAEKTKTSAKPTAD